MGQVRIADLPTTPVVDAESYVIIERPGSGDGTYKSTVSDLQKAITVTAEVTQTDENVHIEVDDINGTTSADLVSPTVNITQEDGVVNISSRDYRGTLLEGTLVSPVINITQNSGTVQISAKDYRGETLDATLESPTVSVAQSGNETHIATHDYEHDTDATIVTPTASIEDNGDNTITLTLTDCNGTTVSTIVSKIEVDSEPTEDSPNFVTSGTVYAQIADLQGQIDTLEGRVSALELSLADALSRLTTAEEALGKALTVEANN